MKSFTLSKPIMVNGKSGPEELKVLELRDPLADEVFDFGLPFRIIRESNSPKFEVLMDGPSFKQWLTRLAKRDAGELGQLSGGDLNTIFAWLTEELAPTGNSD